MMQDYILTEFYQKKFVLILKMHFFMMVKDS
nr:MAG TPA: hypothetical protein [Caudoviricetes sp.]